MVALKNTNHEPRDHYSMMARQSTNNTMAVAELNNILKLVAWGTRLSLALYEFSTSIPTATTCVSKLAKEVNLLAMELRQVAASLKKDRNFPSYDANRTVSEILAQSKAVFQEIETIVPVKVARGERGTITVDGVDAMVPSNSWEWSQNTRLKASYLLGHLDGLKLTLSVLLQCLYVAKITAWSKKERTQIAWDAVETQRMQFQSLIIEQQMALIRANRLYQEYSLSKSAFLELLPNPNHHHMLTQRNEREINPLALVPYQEPSLSQVNPAHTELEDLSQVRRVAQPYVDMLLHRWTRLEEMESRLIESSGSRRSSTRSDRGRWEHPTVESDSEDDFGVPNDPSRRLNGSGPVLMPVHEDEDADVQHGLPTSPVGIPTSPAINVHRSSIPHYWSSPSSSSSPTANPYFPASPPPAGTNALPRSHRSPGPSPLSSPRPSISAEQYTPRPPPPSPPSVNLGAAATTASSSPPRQEIPDQQSIPWRLRLNNVFWDHHGPTITNSNTRGSHVSALNDRNTVTEILASYVSREALEEAALPYRSVSRDSFDGRRTRFDSCFVIQRPMGWEEVRRLITRSDVLRRKRGSDEGGEQRRRSRGGGPLYVQPPPPPMPDRRNSLPVGVGGGLGPSAAAAPQHRYSGRERQSPRSSSENTSEDGEETKRSAYRRASSSAGGAKKERRKSTSGNSIATLGTGVAAGAGLAALLSDLADGLGGL